MGCRVDVGPDGKPVRFLCGTKEEFPPCVSASCRRDGIHSCAYPVKRDGKPEACGRRLCVDHRVYIEELGVSYCPGHARLYQKQGTE